MSELFWTAAELAEVTGIPRSRIYELTAAGRLPVLRYGARRYYPKDACLRWFDTEALAALATVESRAGPPPDLKTTTTMAPNPGPLERAGRFSSTDQSEEATDGPSVRHAQRPLPG